MEKKHIIKLTERQLAEVDGEDLGYLDNGDVKKYNGYAEVSVSGKKDDEEWAVQADSDDIANKISAQTYNRYAGPTFKPHNLREEDTNSDGVDDFYNDDELDTLGDGDENDDLVKIPEGIQRKVDILVSAMQTLSPKQQAIVLNKMIESFDFTSLPYAWLKELRLKINKKKGNL